MRICSLSTGAGITINILTNYYIHENIKNNVAILLANKIDNKPAMTGACKLCPWHDSCKKWVKENGDPTGLFYVGRSKRDTLCEDLQIQNIDDILKLNVDSLMEQKKKDKTFLYRIGKPTLDKIFLRATIMQKTKLPVVHKKIDFPDVSHELFFDIEDDPTREFVYLHGVYERGPRGEKFIDFTAKNITPRAEKEAWSNFWGYIKSFSKDNFAVYYFAPHEKTTYKKMQKMYPDVISEQEVENFFNHPNVIDLYSNIILKYTDWPIGSYSLKELAQYLGFNWRDKTPSGALSIQWFNDYIEKKDEKILKRILLYNEDDCKATMVIKDKIKILSDRK